MPFYKTENFLFLRNGDGRMPEHVCFDAVTRLWYACGMPTNLQITYE